MISFPWDADKEDSDEITVHSDHSSILKIEALGDGTCFLHSFLKCADPDYRKTSKEKERQEIAHSIRRELIPMLRDANPKYPTLESVVEFTKQSFQISCSSVIDEKKGKQFMEFVGICYDYQIIPFPTQIKDYSSDYFDSLEEYHHYLSIFAKYLDIYKAFLQGRESRFPRLEEMKRKEGNRKEIMLRTLPTNLQEFIIIMKNEYENIVSFIHTKYAELQNKLEKEMGLELYNPQNFGCCYIQEFIKSSSNSKPSVLGLYSHLPYNSYFFTANSGILHRFAYYKENLIPRLEDIERILEEPRSFLGDSDIIPFIPGMLDVNIIVIDFEGNQIINEYNSESKQNPWVILCNSNNSHFDAFGYKTDSGLIQTLFPYAHPLITFLLQSKESKGTIVWSHFS